MFSRFFIERPIFARVIALVTVLLGALALLQLPVAQYPQITPPTVRVNTTYPGASAQVVADTVAAPIEQQVTGVENMLYMSSTSAADGSYDLTVTFAIGTNLDTAQVLVQNRVAIAQPSLPEEVKRQGITTKKQSTNIVLFVALSALDPASESVTDLYLSNYATINLRDELGRVDGVGDAEVMGAADYCMRLWLDAEKLKARSLTTQDVLAAVQEQNVQVAAGQVGQPPTTAATSFQYTVTTLGRLADVHQFEDIIVKAKSDQASRITRLKDVGRVELGAQTYDQFFQLNGAPAAGIAIYLLPGANALTVARAVRAKMDQLNSNLDFARAGFQYSIPFDTSTFVEASIQEVYKTLLETAVLVLIVILVFLQDWRAVLIPATTVPVTIIGAFAAMLALGFSINMLTLFGLILAIGIVVDDAIIIVENTAHHISTGLDPKAATIKAMSEMLGPVIGITLVLSAVFLPSAFLGGVTGQLYRQFALTIAATAVISAINALTLKPAQAASYLRPPSGRPKNVLARTFDVAYGWSNRLYATWVAKLLHYPLLVMVVFLALVGVTAWGFLALPIGFLPREDQGYIQVNAQLPDAASQSRQREVVAKINAILKNTKGVRDWMTVGGENVLDGTVASNAAAFYINFEDWEKRGRALGQDAILAHLREEFDKVPGAVIVAFDPPAIEGLGVAGGFTMEVQDRGNVGLQELSQVADAMVQAGNAQSNLRSLNSTISADVPQLFADIDRTKVKSLDVPLSNVFSTLQTYLGSAYVNDFNKFGRTYQVRMQADARFRLKPEDIERLEVRNTAGDMVPLGTLLTVKEVFGPQTITRYNLYPAAMITGEAAPGTSSGAAMKLMDEMARDILPRGKMGYEWTAMSYQEKSAGTQALTMFALAVTLIYLLLAAQYESWLIPAAVILVVPLALLGTVIAVAVRGMDNNIYTQIGIVLIIALASKNAILIVEFARELHAHGRSIRDAAAESARQRFRPILMTSFAFILGVVPLVTATGAGAASRQALGTAVFGGMIASTVLAVFFVPVFYVVFQNLSEWLSPPKPRPAVLGETGNPHEINILERRPDSLVDGD
jgi:hydrophobic/amphiphilic exporter-1 (mainly G- bacteria), HAE1 family